jgi:hypothetical protein
MRVYRAPKSASNAGNNSMSFFALESGDKDHPVGIGPQRLSLNEVDLMLVFVRLAFLLVELKRHNGILPIPWKVSIGVPIGLPNLNSFDRGVRRVFHAPLAA